MWNFRFCGPLRQTRPISNWSGSTIEYFCRRSNTIYLSHESVSILEAPCEHVISRTENSTNFTFWISGMDFCRRSTRQRSTVYFCCTCSSAPLMSGKMQHKLRNTLHNPNENQSFVTFVGCSNFYVAPVIRVHTLMVIGRVTFPKQSTRFVKNYNQFSTGSCQHKIAMSKPVIVVIFFVWRSQKYNNVVDLFNYKLPLYSLNWEMHRSMKLPSAVIEAY